MSNRNSHNKFSGNKGFANPRRQKFVPKTPNSSSMQQRADPAQTLSNSLRQSDSGAVASSTSSTRRVQMKQNGDRVPSQIQSGNFVQFLPQDEAVASGLGADEGGLDPVESQRVVDLLNRELSRLLMLSPKDFWREVASDASLHAFLESFLKFRNRWYDFPYRGARGMVAGIIVGEYELSKRVFMVLYRISSNRDPGAKAADSLSPKNHAVLLQEKKLLELPKLLDICAIYGRENEDLTRLLVVNSIKAQPRIHDDFTAVVTHFLSIAHTMYERCSSSLETLFSSHDGEDNSFRRLQTDYLEVMDFLNDAIVSMDAFVSAFKHAAIFFSCPVETSYGNEELMNTLATLHDSLLPSLQRGFRFMFKAGEGGEHLEKSGDLVPNVAISLKMLSTRIVNFGWKLLYFCYLSDETFEEEGLPLPAATKIFPAKVEDPLIRADILIQTFREISEGVSTIQTERRLTFLQHVEEDHKLLDRVDLLLNKGWILMDDQQIQLLYSIMIHPLSARNVNKDIPSHVPNHVITNNRVPMDEDSAIMESKISQIKDLFPNYGKGFICACLDVYNQNPEEVIERILEEKLHEDLQLLDTSLEEIMPPKASSLSLGPHDKGKGKLLDYSAAAQPTSTNKASSYMGPPQVSSSSSSSAAAVGRFMRKSTMDVADPQTLDCRDEKDLTKTSALASQLEYEDEYDDSFDDLGLSVADSGYEDTEELVGNKLNNSSTPSPGPNDRPSSKWGSRKKPQYFVKDGKNYSYKVGGSVAVANYDEARSVNQAQKASIHGLGRGGNVPFGRGNNIWRFTEESNEDGGEVQQGEVVEGGGRGRGFERGRGRRGGGGGRNHNRKDQSMKKHFSGLTRY